MADDTRERGDPRELPEHRTQQEFLRAPGAEGIVARVGEALGLCSACEEGRGI